MMTLFKVEETHESTIGSKSSYTRKTLAYFESENDAKTYMIKNNLVWSGNGTGSVSYAIHKINVETKDAESN